MRVIYDLPNPFMQVSTQGLCASQHAERLPSSDAAGPWDDGEAAALEPDEPPFRGGVAAEPVGYPCCDGCGAREPCDRHCPQHPARIVERQPDFYAPTGKPDYEVFPKTTRFQLDEAALMSEIEPVPAFLTDNRAEQIEELLELARADQWPAPPVMRRDNG